MPPVSFALRMPFSKHSIAKATVPPSEIVSSECSEHSSLARQIAARSLIPRNEPSEASVSYSGPPVLGSMVPDSYSSATTFLQRIWQPGQPSMPVR